MNLGSYYRGGGGNLNRGRGGGNWNILHRSLATSLDILLLFKNVQIINIFWCKISLIFTMVCIRSREY